MQKPVSQEFEFHYLYLPITRGIKISLERAPKGTQCHVWLGFQTGFGCYSTLSNPVYVQCLILQLLQSMGKYLYTHTHTHTHTLISIKLGLDYRLNYVSSRGAVFRIEYTLLRKVLRYNKLNIFLIFLHAEWYRGIISWFSCLPSFCV